LVIKVALSKVGDRQSCLAYSPGLLDELDLLVVLKAGSDYCLDFHCPISPRGRWRWVGGGRGVR
jgi:hypothetical protein